MIGDYYQGETDDYCFDNIMSNSSTNDYAEMMVQMYLMGGIKNPIKEHGCSVAFNPPIIEDTEHTK